MTHLPRRLSALALLLLALLLAGCASADKNQSGDSAMGGMHMSGSTSGSNGGGSSGTAPLPKIRGVPAPVAMRVLASADWQGMKIRVQTMTPVRFIVFNGAEEQMLNPPKGSSFHLMVMLNDARTGEPIPYSSSVWATITNSAGRIVFNHLQWPMISAYMGPHYGDDVPDLASGRYRLTVLIGPQDAARTSEYKDVWLTTHTVTMSFYWDAKTRSAAIIGGGAGAAASSSSSMSGMAGMSGTAVHTNVAVNGVSRTPSRLIANAYWQGMKIQTRMSAASPVFISDGSVTKRVGPAAGSSFYMSVRLDDEHTSEPVTYAPVYATIKSAGGNVVYHGQMDPTISAFNGPYYGNNVKLPSAGRYTLTLRIDPPRQARHIEYQHVWLQPHTVVEHFNWKPE
jgi:uncharacterized protein involved in high-affinity Fe2+ transport